MKNISAVCSIMFFYTSVFSQIDRIDISIINTSSFTESENSVFISPLDKNIVLNANNRIDLSFSLQQVDAFVSTDGGQTWSLPVTLFTSQADPAAAIGRNGYKYVLFVKGTLDLGIAIHNGTSWNTNSLPSSGNISCTDKVHLWIDNRLYKKDGASNSANEGNLYVASGIQDIIFFRSLNDGQTWTPACSIPLVCSSCQVISGSSVTDKLGVNLQTGPSSEVYAYWAERNGIPGYETSIQFNQSTDAGQTWSSTPTIAINNIRGIYSPPTLPGKSMRVKSFPSMTVNQQNGYIFIVWANQREPCGLNNPPGCNDPSPCISDADIYMIRSTDGGISWDNPIRVNQDLINNCMDQWFPWITCDEASGALVCSYYGSQDCISGNNDCANTYVAISYDQGNTWTETKISDVELGGDVQTYWGSTYVGDYIGVDVSHGKAIPTWTDDRTGTLLTYTNPFDVPCPQDLNLIYGDYFITDEKSGTSFTYDAAYSTRNTLTVCSSASNYKIYSGAKALMTAGNEIVIIPKEHEFKENSSWK